MGSGRIAADEGLARAAGDEHRQTALSPQRLRHGFIDFAEDDDA